MAYTDKRKQSLYFPDDMLSEIMKEAIRLDRSLSWMVQRAWGIAAEAVRMFPSMYAPEAAPGTLAVGQRPAPAPEMQRVPEPVPATAPERQPGSQVLEFISGKFDKLTTT